MHGVAPYGRVESVEPSHFAVGAAYAVVDRHFLGDRRPYVFATRDFGSTWRDITGNLPRDEFVHVVREDPRDPDVLYAGLEQGVWLTFDGGRRWMSLAQNMPPVSVHDLRIQPAANDLIAATHGRSFWILDDLTPLQELS